MPHTQYKDSLGRYMTQSLFFEYSGKGAPFTLKPYDHEGSLSMKILYLEVGDPTEYRFATEVLGSWEHWQKLTKSDWFGHHIAEWRDELEIKLLSEGFLEMHKAAQKSTAAAQWLAEKKWDKNSVGRPSKKTSEQDKAQIKQAASLAEDEAKRLGLH